MRPPRRDTEASSRRIGRRALVLGIGQIAVAGVLAWRLRHMQVAQADEYRLLAEENRINIRLIPPVRGLIYDRNGRLVAGNDQNYRVVIVREDAGDVDAALARLGQLIALAPAEIEKARREIARRSPFVPVTVAEQLRWEDLARVAVNAPALPGITPEAGVSRSYPLGPDFAHIAGYVGPVSDYDLERLEHPDPVLQIPRFQIGKTGVEAKMEEALRGAAGSRRIEVNARGRIIRELGRNEGRPGADIQLTVDHRIQNFAQARLGEESAGAVVMDIATGDLLAIASSPGFDPNLFVRGISVADYRALTQTPYRPLSAKAVQGAYPPGSTFKMVTALAALEAGLIGPEETVFCPGHMTVSGRRFHCWKPGGHGHVGLLESLQQSCDVYYYELAQRVGIDRIAEMARLFGLGERFDLPLSAVAEGLVPDRDWKRAVRGEAWMVGDSLNASIGQGFVLASPLQLAVMTARLAGGRAVMPRLVKSVDGVETAIAPAADLPVSPGNMALVRAAMHAVSNTRRGTAWNSRSLGAGLTMAGKTGTSQVRNITAAERAAGVIRNEDLPWERRDHALFVAYAPHDAPRLAISLVVEHGGGGSAAAAPVARDILLAALAGGRPPLSAYPEHQRREAAERLRALPLRPPDTQPRGGSSRA